MTIRNGRIVACLRDVVLRVCATPVRARACVRAWRVEEAGLLSPALPRAEPHPTHLIAEQVSGTRRRPTTQVATGLTGRTVTGGQYCKAFNHSDATVILSAYASIAGHTSRVAMVFRGRAVHLATVLQRTY